MTAIVFSGPSLPPPEAERLFPEARCYGPAAQGDFILACRQRPRVICLIDGYFEHVPAVTHKEILWTLHAGISVYGASSMGALRAAELAPYGMIGHGRVFSAYANGELEDDDEVAVAHADAEHGFRLASEALVNLRATLARAIEAGVVGSALSERIIQRAKQIFYPERTLPRVLAALEARSSLPDQHIDGDDDDHDHDARQLDRLSAWLRERAHWVDQKRLDAESLLSRVRALLRDGGLSAARAPGDFPHTDTWEQLLRSAEQRTLAAASHERRPAGTPSLEGEEQAVIEEVQLLGPEVFSDMLFAATRRALCVALRRGGSLAEADDGASAELAGDLIERAHAFAMAEIPNVLRALGDYERVLRRAQHKRTRHVRESTRESGLSPDLLREYFKARLQRPVPDDLDGYAASVGMDSAASLVAAIQRELTFLHR